MKVTAKAKARGLGFGMGCGLGFGLGLGLPLARVLARRCPGKDVEACSGRASEERRV